MINFTVGPVQMDEKIRELGSHQIPYFRTQEFSDIMLENEKLFLKFLHAPKDAKAVFMTGSGTASMETSIINTLDENDKVIVVNGGSFGHRFVELLEIHHIPYSEIKLEPGHKLKKEHLLAYEGKDYTAFLVNLHETSTGVLYDIKLISEFCQRNDLFLIVDSISSFLADPFDMKELEADMVITGSQKALALPPGLSLIALSHRAVKRVETHDSHCMYLNLKSALKNQERGQTPFTPAVGTLIQLNQRLKDIDAAGGVESEIEKIGERARYFRERIASLPLEIVSENMSNAVTPLHPLTDNAYEIFLKLKDEYGIWVCPNAGELKDHIFRVGHIGELSLKEYDILIDALFDLHNKGVF